MDVLLPDGDGLDFIANLSAMSSPKIIIHTAAVIGDVRERARAANVEMFVPKPCDLKVLARQIRYLLLHDTARADAVAVRSGAS